MNQESEEGLNLFDEGSSELTFYSEKDNPWVMKIAQGPQILFNREAYPDWKPDDFAEAVFEFLGNIPFFHDTLQKLWEIKTDQ